MRYNKSIAAKIKEMYGSADYTITEICAKVGIHRDTFYRWKDGREDFRKMLEECENQRLSTIKDEARVGLLTLLRGKEWEEVTTEYIEGKDGKPKIKSQKKIKKFIMPSPAPVIFAMKNLDPKNFADINKTELSNPDGTLTPKQPMTDGQVADIISALREGRNK